MFLILFIVEISIDLEDESDVDYNTDWSDYEDREDTGVLDN
jgi:hypothetical protein